MDCYFEGCDRVGIARGLCHGHYKQRQIGRPLAALKPARGTRTLAERFWSKVDRRGPEECWLWTASLNRAGYGTIGIDRGSALASRVSWSLANGPIPPGLDVLHSCDNPPCVNPAHLRSGTHPENMKDMAARNRNRQPKGEANGNAILNATTVVEIRQAYAAGTVSQDALAKRYGVAQSVISGVVHRKAWTHVGVTG